ncbi:MAG: Yip1 domain protein [Chlorobi bacterium OLB5]|nr:MAG: Yip1 domain protein [Chlorobi bacterium OLB5]
MEENKDQIQQDQITAPETQPAENISLGDAMAGVFSEPGNTFTAVKSSQKKNYWLVPLLILIAISIISSFLVTNDEELVSEIKTQQKEAVKKRLDEQVKEGKMTKEQADQQMEQTDKMFGGTMFVVFGLIGSVFGVLVIFFLKALIYWGGLKIFKGIAGYTDIMNVLGLTALITAIQLVVDTVLAILTGKLMMNIGPILLVTKETMSKEMYGLIANFDLINIWYLVIVGIGLAKVSNLKSSVTMPFVFVLWIAWVLLTSFGPFGMFVGR